MKTFKKLAILCTALLATMSLATFAACDFFVGNTSSSADNNTPVESSSSSDEVDPHECPTYVTYTISLTDQDDEILSGGVLEVSQGEDDDKIVFALGATDGYGKFVGTAEAGTYNVSLLYTINGAYEMDDTTITVSEDTKTFDLDVQNNTPNGTETRPYEISFNDDGSATVEVAPSSTVYYTMYKRGLVANFASSAAYSIIYNGQTISAMNRFGTYVATIEFDKVNPSEIVPLAFVNESTTDSVSLTVSCIAPNGEIDTPYILELDTATTVTLADGYAAIFYTYTATEAGTLTVTFSDSTASYGCQYESYDAVSFPLSLEAGETVKFMIVYTGDDWSDWTGGDATFTATFTADSTDAA